MAGNRFPSDHMAGRPGAELGIRGSAKRSLWPTRISLLKAPKATNTASASFPSAACVLGRAASRSKCRLRQGRAASRAEPSQCRKKSAALHTGGSHRLPLRACRNSAPLVGICAARLVPGLVKPHPRGKTRARVRESRAIERDQIMATKTTQKNASNTMHRSQPSRQAIALELVAAHAPSHALVGRLCSTFGLDPVDYEGIRETTKDQISLSAEALQPTVNETAMKIHLQRVVGSFVSSAHGAAQFYGVKVTQARDLTSKLANDDRDEDREGVYGFESRAARARQFAAEAGLTAFALMAAAEGAVDAYTHITGDKWKPYEPPVAGPATVGRKAAEAEIAAFG